MWTNTKLPLWVRVGFYAEAHHGQRLMPHELRQALGGVSAKDVSRAISTAIQRGLLTYDSSARALYTKPVTQKRNVKDRA